MLEEFAEWVRIDGDEAIKVAIMPCLEIDLVHMDKNDGVRDVIVLSSREAHNIGVALIDVARMSRLRKSGDSEPESSHLKPR